MHIPALVLGGEVDHDVELFGGTVGAYEAVVEVEAVGEASGRDEGVVAGGRGGAAGVALAGPVESGLEILEGADAGGGLECGGGSGLKTQIGVEGLQILGVWQLPGFGAGVLGGLHSG